MPTGVPNVSEDIGLPANSQRPSRRPPGTGHGRRQGLLDEVTCKGRTVRSRSTARWCGRGPGAKSQEGHSSVGVNAPSNTWYLPEGSTAWASSAGSLYRTRTRRRPNCQVTYMIEGEGPRTFTKQVGPNTRQTFDVSKDIGREGRVHKGRERCSRDTRAGDVPQ